MIGESVAFLVAAGQARRLRRRALLRRLPRRPRRTRLRCLRAAAEAGAETRRAAATPTAARCPDRSREAMREVVAGAGAAAAQSASTATTTPAAASPTRWPASRRAPPTSRARSTATASAAATPTWSRSSPTCSSSSATAASSDEQLARLTEAVALRRRAAQLHARPRPALRRAATPSPTRAACTSPGVNADPATFEHVEPDAVGNARELLVSELSGQGHGARARRGGRASSSTTTAAPARRRPGQGARAPRATSSRRPTAPSSCCCARRPASTSRCSGWSRGARSSRSAPTAGSRPRPRSRSGSTASATCARPRATARSTRSTGRCARRSREIHPAPRRHRARQLQGPHPRRGQGHRRGHPRAARRVRRPRRLGLDRRVRERDRGLVGGAGGLARARHAARAARPGARLGAPRAGVSRRDPARPAGDRPRGGAARRSRSCAPGRLSLGPRLAEFEARVRRARSGVAHASAVSSGTAGLHLALRAAGVQRRRRGRDLARSRSSPRPTRSLYERARPVFADIDPVTLNLDPDAAAAAVTERTRALLPVHIFGYPADIPAFERARACRSSRTPARRSAPSTPTGRRSARAATRPSSPSTPTSS